MDAALKKFADNQLLRALRAFALERCGRRDEALKILAAIVEEGPESERVLHTMTFTYRSAGRAEEATAAFVAAAKKSPLDIDILTGLFGAYARDMDFVKQQQTALKLSKLDPGNAELYGWWTVCCLAMQARAALRTPGKGPEAAAPLMKLSDTMASRQVQRAGKMPSYEALLLLTDILVGQGRAAEAAAVIDGAASMPGVLAGDRLQLHAAALARAGELGKAAAMYRNACEADPADWVTWHLYLNCKLPGSVALDSKPGCFPVGVVGGLAECWDQREGAEVWRRAAAAQDASGVEAALREARAAVAAMRGQGSSAGAVGAARGVTLAALELALREKRLGKDISDRGLAEAVVAALPAVCCSFSCVPDMRAYLAEVQNADAKAWMAEQIEGVCREGAQAIMSAETGNGSSSAEVKALQCRVNAHGLLHELGLPRFDSTSAAVEHAAALVQIYAANIHLSGELTSFLPLSVTRIAFAQCIPHPSIERKFTLASPT